MTLNLFLTLLIVLCAVSTLLTEAIKKATSEKFSTNLIALIVSLVAGGGGTAMTYVFMGIAFTFPNILAIVCMIAAVWVGSMTSFDKVKQLVKQIKDTFGGEDTPEA